MSLVTDLSLPLDAFPLASGFTEAGVSRFEFEPVVPTDPAVLPFVWTIGTDVADVVDYLRSSSVVASFDVVASSGTAGIYRLEWSRPQADRFEDLFGDSRVTILRGVVVSDGWHLRIRFPTEEALQAFQDDCREAGADPELQSIRGPLDDEQQYGVTPKQREALVLAATAGYFAQPRETSLAELADRLDISRQAFAGRLRRGHRNLVFSTLRGIGTGTG